MANKYKWANAECTTVNDIESGVYGIHPGVHLWEEVKEWLDNGNDIEEFLTTEELAVQIAYKEKIEQERTELAAVRNNPALKALVNMTPIQVGQWIDSNVTSLASAKDVIKTLAMAVCILARRL